MRQTRMLDRWYRDIFPTKEPGEMGLMAVDATPVFKYWMSFKNSRIVPPHSTAYGLCIKPPAEYTWIEFSSEDLINTDIQRKSGGVIVAISKKWQVISFGAFVRNIVALESVENALLMKILAFSRMGYMEYGSVTGSIDEFGYFTNGYTLWCTDDLKETFDDRRDAAELMLEWITDIFLFALTLMNCKNVTIINTPAPRKKTKRPQRRKKPDIVYKTLDVRPIKTHSRTRAGDGSGPSKRLHMVRGHFKDYRRGQGLFGKYHDIYWYEQHTCGDADVGVVDKDYRVLAN